MFKRFSVSEDVSTQTSLKSSAVRALKKAVADALPAAVAGAGAAALEVVLPPARKGEVLEGKGRDRTTFVILDGVPLFFKARDGPNLPTLRLLHACASRRRRCIARAGNNLCALYYYGLPRLPTLCLLIYPQIRCCFRACRRTLARSSLCWAGRTSCAAA